MMKVRVRGFNNLCKIKQQLSSEAEILTQFCLIPIPLCTQIQKSSSHRHESIIEFVNESSKS